MTTYSASWRSPSNIALIKYWGKHGVQLPRNPSLSFTLSACHTEMTLEVMPTSESPGITVLYEGQPRPSFEPKIHKFFELLHDVLPWLSHASVHIDSRNTFPHGAGIASSASAMSAMALCLLDIHDQITSNDDNTRDPASWWRKASEIARMGSGSACRSLYPTAAVWGQTGAAQGSSDTFAIPWGHEVAPVFRDYRDTILIISASEKPVSSTTGHALMDQLPYATVRYQEAERNTRRLIQTMKTGDDLQTFISIVESEALQLHALMMSGDTPFILMQPGTLSIIQEVWRFRKETGIPVCFTLDAGPNVHLLYAAEHEHALQLWIDTVLLPYCTGGTCIHDRAGGGPEKIPTQQPS